VNDDDSGFGAVRIFSELLVCEVKDASLSAPEPDAFENIPAFERSYYHAMADSLRDTGKTVENTDMCRVKHA